MRKRYFPLLLTILPVMAALLSACTLTPLGNTTTDKASDVTEVKDFTNFDQLEIGSAFEVEITRSDNYTIVIIADESLIDLIEVTQDGDTVKIFLNPRHIFTDFTIGEKTLRAEITLPALQGLVLSGASTGTVSGFNSISNFDLVVSGASSLDKLDMVIGDAEFEVSGASRVSGNLTAGNLEIKVSGASSVELSGQADSIDLRISGASRVDLTDVPVGEANVTLSGASEATINVSGALDIELSGASRFFFYGNPVMGDTNVSGASTIKHK